MTEDPKRKPLTYETAGVNLQARQDVVGRYREVAKGARRPEVLGGIGPFAGLFALGSRFRDPVIVSSTDGVGTKTKIAGLVQRYESLGHDIVANCVNDAFTTGAEPLFFLDYIGSYELAADAKVAIVKGIADACAAIDCALLGGETADMPGVYPPGEFDLVGFIVGAVERDQLIDGTHIVAGDLLFGLPSNGLHTNGYSLARRALDLAVDEDRAVTDCARLERHDPDLGESLADAILRPHHCYVPDLRPVLNAVERPTLSAAEEPAPKGLIKGMAHITGGGFEENVPRILPEGLGARLNRSAWPVPPIFPYIQRAGGIEDAEMYRVFNMGLGIVFAVAPDDADKLREAVPHALLVGEVTDQTGIVLQ